MEVIFKDAGYGSGGPRCRRREPLNQTKGGANPHVFKKHIFIVKKNNVAHLFRTGRRGTCGMGSVFRTNCQFTSKGEREEVFPCGSEGPPIGTHLQKHCGLIIE